MTDFLLSNYIYLKAIHVILVIYWMAGLLMIPRFYVYHFQTDVGSQEDIKWQEREARLFKIILNPAMRITFVIGISMALISGLYDVLWFQIKFALIIAMTAFHEHMGAMRKKFANGERPKSEKYFRMTNEIPSFLIIFIVFLALVKPF